MTKHIVSLDAEHEAKLSVPEGAAPASAPARTHRLRKLLLTGAAVLGLAGAAHLGWDYWTVGRFLVSTDDAYVQADNTTVAPKVSGYLAAVLVDDNEAVRAGQVLARIDDRDFRTALAQADADLQAARATVASRQAALDLQQSVIAAARATTTIDSAAQVFADQDDKRYAALAVSNDASLQHAQQARSRDAIAHATVARDAAALATAVQQTAVLQAEFAQAQAALQHAEAARDQARLNLGYTSITAAVDGVVGNRTLRVGQYVQAGTQLMAIVPVAQAYVVANYKETQLADVRPGQDVSIAVDMFPGVTAHGHVASLAPASGQEFALLPPDNATGNFTKIVQRIPVKIVLDPGSPLVGMLRPGMSVSPAIETKSAAAPTSTAYAPARLG